MSERSERSISNVSEQSERIISNVNEPLMIADAAAAIRAGELTSAALTEAVLGRIDRGNERLGAVFTRCDDTARTQAAIADKELAAGQDRGPLHGIPVGVKDILATADAPTKAHSMAMFPGFEGYDSAAVARLRDAGAVIVAKATCSEFASGLPDPTKPFPIPRNPWDLDRWAGGSSGGSASGIVAGFFLGALGTDTGGSIRVPASFCGITGHKPTSGLVSRFGCVPLSATMDHVGPMGRSARDCALVLDALAGFDERDPASEGAPASTSHASALDGDLTGVRIGVDRAHHARAGLRDEVVGLFEDAVTVLEAAGATVVEVDVPLSAEIYAAGRALSSCEIITLHRDNLRAHWDDYGGPTRVIFAGGSFYSAMDFLRARAILDAATPLVVAMLADVDCVASPTLPMVSWRLEEGSTEARHRVTEFTSMWNGMGMPSVAIPHGLLAADGAPEPLPMSIQFSGARFSDATLLRVADAYQARTDWHRRVPPLFPS